MRLWLLIILIHAGQLWSAMQFPVSRSYKVVKIIQPVSEEYKLSKVRLCIGISNAYKVILAEYGYLGPIGTAWSISGIQEHTDTYQLETKSISSGNIPATYKAQKTFGENCKYHRRRWGLFLSDFTRKVHLPLELSSFNFGNVVAYGNELIHRSIARICINVSFSFQ